MADDNTRSLSKLKEQTKDIKERLKGVRNKLKEAREGATEANKMASKVPAYLLPVLGGVEGYLLGYADEMVKTPEVQTPVTMAVGGAAWLGSGVAAYFGAPTWANLAGNAAANAAAVVTHAAGRQKAATVRAAAPHG